MNTFVGFDKQGVAWPTGLASESPPKARTSPKNPALPGAGFFDGTLPPPPSSINGLIKNSRFVDVKGQDQLVQPLGLFELTER